MSNDSYLLQEYTEYKSTFLQKKLYNNSNCSIKTLISVALTSVFFLFLFLIVIAIIDAKTTLVVPARF